MQTEDAILIFNDRKKKPVLVRVSCLPAERQKPCSANLFAVDLTYPTELQCLSEAVEDHSDFSDDSREAVSTYLEGTGWVDDYGNLVRPQTSVTTAQNVNRVSKSEILINWESLKRSYN